MSCPFLVTLAIIIARSSVIDAKPELVAHIEVNRQRQYRVQVRLSGHEPEAKINRLSFKIPSAGLGPVGARIQVRRSDGKLVGCSNVVHERESSFKHQFRRR